MADPITLAAIGATAGAVMNPNDPVKGALVGGTLGYGGGALAGVGATQAAAPVMNATYAAGVPEIAGLTAQQAPIGLLGSGNIMAGAPVIGVPTESMINGIPVSSYNIPFDPIAYEQYAGLQGAMRGAGSLANATMAGNPMQQLGVANQLLARNQQAQQRLPAAPAIQSRPYTGMRQPINPQEEEMRRRLMYSMPQMKPIRLI